MRAALLIVLILSQAAAPARADSDPDPRLTGDALGAFRQGEYAEAAGLWEALGRDGALASPDVPLAFALAAIARERARDAAAYRDWGEAIRLFLEGGTRWEDARNALRERVEQIRKQVRVAAAGGADIMTGHGQGWLALDDFTGLSVYDGPPPGLVVIEPRQEPLPEPPFPSSLPPDGAEPPAPAGWERISSRQAPVDAPEADEVPNTGAPAQ